ncbi:serine hydrolase domain-containing protein [Pseudozobellia thermophila]|uniref:CubicO group peptidase, beta-lactamase class C family n=1 Tax=Pseudozobellia thermophila TaxID=192903 RepID=A0A1M6BGS3_9FLAO|nr:serine hydrolase [Pseudozobellia thermophila]SHI47905.1 CubicO group peptidase, beta-lactamase class C family [Pseudozobellia thermophila]
MKQLSDQLIELIRSEYENIAGIVVYKNGSIACEEYFHGYNEHDTIHIASVTKSIVSILLGIAIDQGHIKSIEQKVLDFFPGYTIKRREKTIQKVTLRHLITMTAPYKFKSEPYTKVYSSEDWTKSVLDLLGGKTLTEEFKYTTIGLQALSGVLIHATGQPLLDFAAENLFSPLGIKAPKNIRIYNKEEHFAFLKDKYVNGWVIDPKGANTSGWGLTLTTRDIAKIGQLYLNGGRWQNRQIVSSRWVAHSTKKHSQWNGLYYGYLWWIIDGKENKRYAAIGDGGNIIYVDTEDECVVAITSRFKPRAKDRIELIEKNILPQIGNN